VENGASQRVMLRVGMTFREAIRYDGQDGHVYGVESPDGQRA
jgi:hypothetical protein